MIPQRGRIAEAIQLGFYLLLRRLPSEWASAIGGHGIRWNARANRPEIIEGARCNLKRHRPDASEAEIEGWIDEFLDGVGRVQAETAVMHRFMDEGRISVTGSEAFSAGAGKVPIIALCVHTGNWETFSLVFQKLGVRVASIIAPPTNALERRILDETRRRYGIEPLEPTIADTRRAIRVLKENGIVSMFPDEARNGTLMGPLFGRKPHLKGNLAIAARLARITGAKFVLGHCRRVGTCRFEITGTPLFELPPSESPDPLADVAFLNSWIEPVVLKEIPRWYFLDDAITPINENAS